METNIGTGDGSKNVALNSSFCGISNERMNAIMQSYEDAKQTSQQLSRIGAPNPLGEPNTLIHKADVARSNDVNIKPQYDPELLMYRRMVCSEDIPRKRLIVPNENMRLWITKSSVEEEMEDEAFYEHLKKRISQDIENKIQSRTEMALPKRTPKTRKRKSPFSNECLKLISKYRAQSAKNSPESSLTDNGIFSLAAKSNSQDRENSQDPRARENNMMLANTMSTMKAPNVEFETPINHDLVSDTDREFGCPTPTFVKNSDDNMDT